MTLAAGTKLGPYEILSRIVAGGMGEVWKARDTRLGREVAVKVVHPRFAADAEHHRRFEQEARAASQLDHPNILVVHDVGTHEGSPYIVSELLQGESLREKLGPPLPAKKAIDYAVQIAQGLAAAHEKGIVHRDIKPENLFITKDGHVKILDFGIAKLLPGFEDSGVNTQASTEIATQAGTAVGTVPYMSPEQVRGEGVDHRSDIFSFGAVFYELLTGRKAFGRGTAAETIAAILKEEPPELSEGSLPPGLAHAVGHCLEKNPDERFQSLRDVVFVLQEAGLPSAASVTPSPPVRPPRSGTSMGIGLRLGLAAAAIAVLASLAILLGRQRRAAAPHSAASPQEQTARIVVLPFENLGTPEDAYFASGMTEEITSRLANVRKLGVISRTTATEYPRKGKTVKQIGADLGVDWVLEGTIRCDRSGTGPGRVRITPQLIRVADDTHVWSDRYERTLTDIFALQSDVATKTVEAIGINLLPAEKSSIETIPTRDLVAYDEYLKGLAAEARSEERSDVEEALGHFQAAAERDPSFAGALGHLAFHHLSMYWLFYDRSEERLRKARAAAEAAARVGPNLPESHDALGYLAYWGFRDYDRAIEEFETARRLRPSDAQATAGLAYVFRRLGRWEDSAAMLAEVTRLDPRKSDFLFSLGQSLLLSRRYPEADRVFATALALSPNSGTFYGGRVFLELLWRGDLTRARTLLGEAERVPGLRDDQAWLALWAYRLTLAERDFAGALQRLDAHPGNAYAPNQFFFLPVDLLRSEVHRMAGNSGESRRAAERARVFLVEEIRKQPEDGRLESALGITLALLGRNDEALRAARRGIDLTKELKDAWIGDWRIEDLAYVCTLTGRQDEAIEQLGVLLSASGEMSPPLLRLDPRWDPLRKNPKFEALLAKYEVRS